MMGWWLAGGATWSVGRTRAGAQDLEQNCTIFFQQDLTLKVKKKTTSPTPIIETAHLELEVVILDEVLNQLVP